MPEIRSLVGAFISIIGEAYNVQHPNGKKYDTVDCEYRLASGRSFNVTFNFPVGTSWYDKISALPKEHEVDTSYLVKPQECHGGRCSV